MIELFEMSFRILYPYLTYLNRVGDKEDKLWNENCVQIEQKDLRIICIKLGGLGIHNVGAVTP